MTSPKHSPAPWRVERGIVVDAYATRVATPDGEDLEGERANARLIAAAPELLAALREIAKVSREDYGPAAASRMAEIAGRAITKAEG